MSDFPDLPAVLAADERFAALADMWVSRLAAIDPQEILVRWIERVDISLLPLLAEEYSLLDDGWELAETEQAQRAMLQGAIRLHKIKGTPAAIREVFRMLGLGEVVIEEGRAGRRRDGAFWRDGFAVRGQRQDNWAEYRIKCSRQLSIKQAAAARRLLASVAPARCHLVEINFTDAALIRNGYARRDGTYTRGSV
ncbi:phage tail protein [Chromobacterium violaceum]|uniref:phage tail protein n=1 Tax=Chromobacterium violaceum TaxID=536 RepID=UPI0019519C81|nr:phage tail protein [Chromobacterium violaceum]QRO34118.1 phage tail protein [Chromobacterium violaceum]QRQ16079.1 phage tail protein [Chromobacterium violaceum]